MKNGQMRPELDNRVARRQDGTAVEPKRRDRLQSKNR
jgi:hypothetical protein